MASEFFDDRLDWNETFMARALLVSMRSSCLMRRVGAVVVKDKRIIGSGYNGAAPNVVSCKEKGKCLRKVEKVESGRDKEYCQALHGELNAILNAGGRKGCNNADMYATTFPCTNCSQAIVGAGVSNLFYLGKYDREKFSLSEYTLGQANVTMIQIPDDSLEKIVATFDELSQHLKDKNFRFIDREKYV